jgi:hypothetical protein
MQNRLALSAPSCPGFPGRTPFVRGLIASLMAGMLAPAIASASPTPEQIAFFETKIRPVLAQHCYQCHSAEALRATVAAQRAMASAPPAGCRGVGASGSRPGRSARPQGPQR